MTGTLTQARSFGRPMQLLLLNQLTINTGFYMLMPYLAGHLSQTLGLAAWTVGLILGVRNLSQQGMFLVGGTLADRLGYKPMIIAGLALRVAGFALLGLVDSLPALLAGSALTGLAGALFNPAVRAYVAAEAGERQPEAFAVFNVFYQAGILIGPLVGLVLIAVDFRWVCLVAAALFAVLMAVQWRTLPARAAPTRSDPVSVFADWRTVVGNRSFVLFSAAMIGSYVLNYQVYLALPMQVRQVTGGETGVAVLFVVSGLLTITGQVRVTAWLRRRYSQATAMSLGVLLMATAFVPLLLTAGWHFTASPPGRVGGAGWVGYAAVLAPAVLSVAVLTVATMVVYPFEMSTIVTLSGNRLVATHYGFYNTVSGIGIAAGNLLIGAVLDVGRQHGLPALPWAVLCIIGLTCAAALYGLQRRGHLSRIDVPAGPAAALSR